MALFLQWTVSGCGYLLSLLSQNPQPSPDSTKRGLRRLPVLFVLNLTGGLPRGKQTIEPETAAGHESVPRVFG